MLRQRCYGRYITADISQQICGSFTTADITADVFWQMYYCRNMMADLLWQKYYSRYITADIWSQIYYGRHITADVHPPNSVRMPVWYLWATDVARSSSDSTRYRFVEFFESRPVLVPHAWLADWQGISWIVSFLNVRFLWVCASFDLKRRFSVDSVLIKLFW